jgi:hypothetical protein
MGQPAKKRTIEVPAAWGDDPLSAFLDDASGNMLASFALLPDRCAKVRDVDGALTLLCKNLSDAGDWLTPMFVLKAHSAYRAAAGLAMAGQTPEAFALMRTALESALYGLYVHSTTGARGIWLDRSDGIAQKNMMKATFTMTKMWACLKAADEQLQGIAQALYDRTIELGAHPNVASIAIGFSMEKHEKGATFKLAYLTNDQESISTTLKSVAQIGVTVLKIFSLAFPARCDELGLPKTIETLCVGL